MFSYQRFGYAAALLWLTFAVQFLSRLACSRHASSGCTVKAGISNGNIECSCRRNHPSSEVDNGIADTSDSVLLLIGIIVLIPIITLLYLTFTTSNRQSVLRGMSVSAWSNFGFFSIRLTIGGMPRTR